MLETMGGVQELQSSLLWENNPWGDISTPENLGPGGVRLEKVTEAAGQEDKKEEKKQPPAAATVVLATMGRKRGRGGGRLKSCSNGAGGAGGRRGSGGGDDGGGDDDHSSLDDHENHIVTERERRKKMRTMFATLHSMLPQLPPKADKSSIVDEAVNHIKTLEQTVQNLEKQVFERLHGVTTINYDRNDSSREAFMADQGYSPLSNISNNSSNLTITPTNSSNNLVSLAPPPISSPAAATFPVLYQTYTSPNVVLNVCGNQAQISVCSVKKQGLLTAICYVLEKYKLEVVSAHVSSDYNRSIYMIQVHAGGMFDQAMEAFPVEEMYKQAAAEIMYWVASG